MEAYKVMLVAFVVAQEDVLAMYASVILPPSLCFLYGLALWMVVTSEWNVMLVEIVQYDFFSCHESYSL